jgi:hypothetical protein
MRAVVLGLAAAGLLAAPPVAQVTNETTTARPQAASTFQDGDQEDRQTAGGAPIGIVSPSGPVVFVTESAWVDVIRGESTPATSLIVVGVTLQEEQIDDAAESQQADDAEQGALIDPCSDLAVFGLRGDGDPLTRGELPVDTSGATDATSEAARDEPTPDGVAQLGGADLIADRAPWPAGARDSGGIYFCTLELVAQMGADDPAIGWLTVVHRGVATVENGQLREYRVARSSSWQAFLYLIMAATVAGLIGVCVFVKGNLVKSAIPTRDRGGKLRRRARRKLSAPTDHPLRGSWVTSLAAVGAAASTLLAASGALSELAPQYQIGKVVVGNILVVTLLAIAAALISSGSHEDKVKVGYATGAVFAAVSAIAAQLLLTALVLIHASTHELARWVVAFVALVTWGVLVSSVRAARY